MKTPPLRKKEGNARKAMHWLGANAFGVGFALIVFLALPLLQIVATSSSDKTEVRQVAVTEAPPAPEIEEDKPPEPEPEPEEQPEMKPMENLSLADMELSLNPGASGGTGAQVLNDAMRNVANQAADLMSAGGAETQPRAVFQPSPSYPAELAKRKVSGVVKMEIVVDANGRVTNPRVISSSHPAFQTAALAAIKQWRFEPGMRDGNRASFRLQIPMRFGTA